MSRAMTPAERGDMAQALLPEAAALTVEVHEGAPQDIATRLAGLSRHELEGLAVVLAAMVDPDRSMNEALGWVDFDEHGDALGRSSKSRRTVREMQRGGVNRERGVDEVSVRRALAGERIALSRDEVRLAVDLGIRGGMSYEAVAEALGMQVDAVKQAWERAKKRARATGRWVPPGRVGEFSTAA